MVATCQLAAVHLFIIAITTIIELQGLLSADWAMELITFHLRLEVTIVIIIKVIQAFMQFIEAAVTMVKQVSQVVDLV